VNDGLQVKVGCCGFAAQKMYFELFNNHAMKEDALRFLEIIRS